MSNVPWQSAVPLRGRLARSPAARDREIARVLDHAGRAVLLVHGDDPVGLGRSGGSRLALLHRSWLAVFGQHPRLCVLAREDAAGGAIDVHAPYGPALAHWIVHADTAEPWREMRACTRSA